MGPDSNNPHTSSGTLTDTTVHLKKAVADIDRFALENISAPLPSCAHLDIHDNHIVRIRRSSLQRAILLAKSFLSSLISRNSQKNERLKLIQRQLLRSVDTIKNHHLLLDRLQQGDDEQKLLAQEAMDAIERYNSVVEKRPPKRKLARFLLRRCGWDISEEISHNPIDLPQKISVVKGSRNPIDHAAKAAMVNEKLLPATEEVDAFRMKAISMILQQSHPCLKEVMKQLRDAPISTVQNSDQPVIAMQQNINPFPGEVIEVKGAFQRNGAKKGHSVPILKSFSLFSESTQTGFPHPCQHTGFALSNELIVAYPHRPALLKTLPHLLERKRQLALKLLPQGELIAKGKQILQCKQTAFDKTAKTLLPLHLQFIKTLYHTMGGKDSDLIEAFYEKASCAPSPFQYLSQEFEAIAKTFIAEPFAKLQQTWVEHTLADLHDPSAQRRLDTTIDCLTIASQGDSFMTAFGKTLSETTKEIVVQQFSEKMEYPPQPLSKAAKVLQALLYKQQSAFLEEFELSWDEEKMQKRLVLLIEEDCSLIENNQSDIVDELAEYYNRRYEQITQ